MRRLVVCADGTWNAPHVRGDGQGDTNVVRIHAAVAPFDFEGVEQRAYYHPGVGVGTWWDRITGGAFGVGLSHNVQECYRFLVDHFTPGDELYLFGFSRGAYTVRSLAGLIRNCGILRPENRDMIGRAYELYRDRGEDTHPNAKKAVEFREDFSHETPIRCIGVWDTVGALGVPTRGPLGALSRRRYGFHDVRLSSRVQNAFHALAIDERREPFAPSLWEVPAHEEAALAGRQRMEQIWFAGVHSNVGGGYPDRGLSDIALLWMIDKARSCGLAFDDAAVARLAARVDGTLYDSMAVWFRPFGVHERELCAERQDVLTFEDVHESVIERRRGSTPRYEPANFVRFWKRRPDRWLPDRPPGMAESTPALPSAPADRPVAH